MPIPPVEVKITANGTQAEASVRRTSRVIRKQFQQVELQTKKLATSTDRLADGFLRVGRNVAAFAGVGFGVSAIRSVTNEIRTAADELNKFSRRLDISVEEVQKLRFISGQVGVNESEFDRSIDRFVKRIGEAVEGQGEAAPAFKSLGIDLFQLDEGGEKSLKKPVQLLNEVAAAFQNVETGAQKAAITAKLFGREGIKLVNVLNLGPAGIEQLGDELERLGSILDEKTLKNAETLSDEIDRLGRVVDVRLTKFFLDLAPAIEGLARNIREFGEEGGFAELGEAIATFSKIVAAALVAKNLLLFADLAKKAGAGLTGIAVAAQLSNSELRKYGPRIKKVTALLVAATVAAKGLNFALRRILPLAIGFAIVEKAVDAAAESAKKLKEETAAANKALADELEELRGTAEFQALTGLKKESEATIKELRKLEKATEKVSAEIKKFSDQDEDVLRQSVNAQKKILKERVKAVEDSRKDLESLIESFEEVEKKINQPRTARRDDVLGVNSAIRDAQNLLNAGDKDEAALDTAKEARDLIEKLSEEGKALDTTLRVLLEQAEKIAVEAQKNIIAGEEQKAAQAEEDYLFALEQLKTELERLQEATQLKVTVDESSIEEAQNEFELLRADLERKLNIPITVSTDGMPRNSGRESRTAASEVYQGTGGPRMANFATGGFVSGPGTRTSDSIHARLSNGEYVMKADAVSRYGLGLMNQINNMKLPKFKDGGPVGRPVNLNISGQSFPVSAKPDVVNDLQRHVRLQALAQGRRV